MGRADVYSQPAVPDPMLPADLVRELIRPHLSADVRLGPLPCPSVAPPMPPRIHRDRPTRDCRQQPDPG